MNAPEATTPHGLLQFLPGLRLPLAALGQYPTPVQHLPGLGDVWAKREDQSSAVYGGNKVRTLETLLAAALAGGRGKVVALGSYGSNHAVAAILHGKRLGLQTDALLFPQPATPVAAENLRVTISHAARVTTLRSIATFPLQAWLRYRRNDSYVMAPGGAVPLGALGHAGAALELAAQVRQGLLPAPAHIVLAAGSTCTSAGLLAGLLLAKHLGLWPGELPRVQAVPVTPWPVTARFRIAGLARRTLAELAARGGPDLSGQDPGMLLVLRGGYLGWGYGRPTRSGIEAAASFMLHGGPPLDTTYANKSGAALLDRRRQLQGPVLYWSTKSSVPLPPDDPEKLANAPAHVRRWLRRCVPG
ncbi:MAG: pyridoxal-phosphate dependent enzyme [Planctomycetes bacterium]|nr:pyridoxal-phosphate dependent enzyme [Planctomycetota bacterium]